MKNMNPNQIYHLFAQTLHDAIKEEYTEAHLEIKYTGNSTELTANYQNVQKQSVQLEFNPEDVFKAVGQLHSVTTEGGKNRWNRLGFQLFPTGTFNLNFRWDQDLADELDYYKNGGSIEEWEKQRIPRA